MIQILREKVKEMKENNGRELDKCDPAEQKERFKELMDQALERFMDII